MYDSYDRSDELLFPVASAVPTEARPLKARCIVVGTGPDRRLYPFDVIAQRVGETGSWSDPTTGVTFHYARDPDVVWATSPEATTVAYGFWFAWYAMDPGITVVGG